MSRVHVHEAEVVGLMTPASLDAASALSRRVPRSSIRLIVIEPNITCHTTNNLQ